MISESRLLLKMHKQSLQFIKEERTQFVEGLIRGLAIAIVMIKQTSQDTRNINSLYKGRLNRWSASRFRQAIDASLGYLKRGDRARGIRILENAVEHESAPMISLKS